MKFQVIIPARYASSRFPGKPLAMLGSKPMIQWVYERAKSVIDDVCVATDDQRIYNKVIEFGGNVVMTQTTHRSGTDRICEACNLLNTDADVVVNLQGDEPFVNPEQIRQLMNCFSNSLTQIATLVRPFQADEDIFNPNIVKAVFAQDNGRALYFSRAAIPCLRGVEQAEWSKKHTYYAHIGMYAYRLETLRYITHLSPSPLEQAESLEQLRWLEAGIPVTVALTQHPTIGIDTPEDLLQAQLLVGKL